MPMSLMSRLRPLATAALLAGAAACDGGEPADGPGPVDVGPEPSAQPPEPRLRRLTTSGWRRTVTDLFGDGLVLPTIEPDQESGGLLTVGAAEAAVSPRGAEQYEAAALAIADQVSARLTDGVCAPVAVDDEACFSAVLGPLGRRVWRRPLAGDELAALVALAAESGRTLGSFSEGLEIAVAAMLQSPYFLYRIELGEDDPERPGERRFTGFELASRLSYFLWDTTPDDALLDAAASGALDTADGLAAEVDRMLADPRARAGFRAFVAELLTLRKLDALVKTPSVFPAMRSDVGPSAKEEALAMVEALVFDRDDDLRTWLTTRETSLNPTLAMLYGVPAPSLTGFAPATLPADGARAGLLGQAAVLTQHAHPVSSSATRRGVFVREVLLCQDIPPPPANANTAIPEPSAEARTLRERVAVHLESPACASCHEMTDPIGLGLENFDGLGQWRTMENGAPIDPAGDLDGDDFTDPAGLGRAVAAHEDFTACMTETLYAYAQGHRPVVDERATLEWLHARFAADGFSTRDLLRHIATSDAFRHAGAIDEEAP